MNENSSSKGSQIDLFKAQPCSDVITWNWNCIEELEPLGNRLQIFNNVAELANAARVLPTKVDVGQRRILTKATLNLRYDRLPLFLNVVNTSEKSSGHLTDFGIPMRAMKQQRNSDF